ncbi:heme peroxidase [Cynara cardunculus var. scolymus]|uniref:Peroxidase n=1 Tax=Cynara cardunculus var. scolymus TaxID=59895 RepID=A0A103YJ96_CYNCS|nr:heme peroxidase [Cynara cardunculus var. scolymus]
MVKMSLMISAVAAFILLLTMVPLSEAALSANYYDQMCPQAENIIYQTVCNASIYDPKVPARLLRMFFHDCFIRGCDASLLLDSTPENKAEKDGPPNISVRSFYVIDDAKTKLEKACPNTVSCADSQGPWWNVLKGRKDGRVSIANETRNLPSPFSNTTTLIQSFAKRGLSIKDLVALSGGHTLGFSHCSSFSARLHNFSAEHFSDPSINSEFAINLKKKCPIPNKDHNAGEFLDSTSSTFDNDYYKRIVMGKGVFGSDQALFEDYRTRWIVDSFAKDEKLFFREFAASMVKLGNVGVIEDGEIRVKCSIVN